MSDPDSRVPQVGSKPLRVLLSVPSLDDSYGGPIQKALLLAEAVRAHGVAIDLVGAGTRRDAVALGSLGTFHGTPIPRHLAPMKRAASRADLVHVLGYRDPVTSMAVRTAEALRIPFILEPLGTVRRQSQSFRLKSAFDRTIGGRILRSADLIIASSPAESDDLVAAGIEPSRITVRPNPVLLGDLVAHPRGSWRTAHDIPHDGFLVATVARLSRIKRLQDIACSLPTADEVWWAVAGPDEHDGTLEEILSIVRDRGLADRVRVLPGGVWGVDRDALLADADVFCLTSERESFGSAIAEAAAAGVPVVATASCGVAPLLPRPPTQLVTPGDVPAIRRALGRAVVDRAAAGAARAAAEEFRRSLAPQRIGAQQVTIYEDLARLAGRRGAR